MITSEEAKKNAKQCYSMVKTNMTQDEVWEYERKNIETQKYITQQEMVNELLDEILKVFDLDIPYMEIGIRVDTLIRDWRAN